MTQIEPMVKVLEDADIGDLDRGDYFRLSQATVEARVLITDVEVKNLEAVSDHD